MTATQEQKKIGLRFKSARILSGLNQEEFAQACGFNHTSLRNWEFGRAHPRSDAVRNFIDALRNFDVFVSRDWLIAGIGEGPMLFNNEAPFGCQSIGDPAVSAFKKSVEKAGYRAIIETVLNEDMMPRYKSGDILGGISTTIHEIELLQKQHLTEVLAYPVLCKIDESGFQPRWLVFDGHRWLARDQGHLAVSLKSSIIGRIIFCLQIPTAVGELK